MRYRLKKATLVVSKPYLNNAIFDESNTLNRDNCLYMFHCLNREFDKKNIRIATQDIHAPSISDYVLYTEIPDEIPALSEKNKTSVVIFESDIIMKKNWDQKSYQYFNKVFTWSPELVDGKKYIKINFAHKIPKHFKISQREKQKFCCLIASNKMSGHKNELYSERIKAIRWFEKNQPEKFDLYGLGWEAEIFKSQLLKKFNRLLFLRRMFKNTFPSYKGTIEEKLSILGQYKYAICYENGKNIKGYVTEKIFDCFFAGVIPIYLGAPDILDYIPANTFIDKNKFQTYEALYRYLDKMPDAEYQNYFDAIESFVKGSRINAFDAEHIAQTIVNNIIE